MALLSGENLVPGFPAGKWSTDGHRWSSWHEIHGEFNSKNWTLKKLETLLESCWVSEVLCRPWHALTYLQPLHPLQPTFWGWVLNRLDAASRTRWSSARGSSTSAATVDVVRWTRGNRWTDGPMDPGDSQVAFEKWVRNKPSMWPYGWFRMVYVDGIALPTLSRLGVTWIVTDGIRWNMLNYFARRHDW